MNIYLRYFLVVIVHKWFVFVECVKRGIPIHGLIHDMSKFSKSEFGPYARYYAIAESEREESCEFSKAWDNHKDNNRHHPEWWVRPGGPIPMDETSRLEMLCDWIAAEKSYKGMSAKAWYEVNKEDIPFHPDTREWVESQFQASY